MNDSQFWTELTQLRDEAEDINPWAPWFSLERLVALSARFNRLRPEYEASVGQATMGMLSPEVSGGGIAGLQAGLQISSTTGIAKLLTLQDRWHQVAGTIDQKLAVSLAMVGVYLGAFALIISLIPLF